MLYQDVRPTKLSEFLGPPALIANLEALLKKKHKPHSFLFQGPKGCGKTTLARIVARGVGADDADIIELNAANTRGIDTIRKVTQESGIRPLMSASKAYIFDESQQLTGDAQEALLKVTEECPPQTYFFFCTTDPQNLKETLRSRCATYTVDRMRKPMLKKLLLQVIEQKKLVVAEAVVDEIVDHADGIPRTALVMLEQVEGLASSEDMIALIKAEKVSEKSVIDLCRELVSGRTERWRLCLDYLAKIPENPEGIRLAILGYLKTILLNSKSIEDADRMAQLIRVFEPPTFSGGLAMLSRMVFEACFID